MKDSTIVVKLDDKEVVNWTQPADWAGTKRFQGAADPIEQRSPLQAHDPGSTVTLQKHSHDQRFSTSDCKSNAETAREGTWPEASTEHCPIGWRV